MIRLVAAEASEGPVMASNWAQTFVARALVFDLDGVLADTESLFHQAINALLAEEGLEPFSEDAMRRALGKSNSDYWRTLHREQGLRLSLDDYTARIDELFTVLLQREMVPAPGVRRLLDAAKGRELPVAVASSADRHRVSLKLEILGLVEAFNVVVGGDQVSRGKPDPEIYRAAVTALGVPPYQAMAFEDSLSGVRSATAAGLYTVAVRTGLTRDLDLSAAHQVVDSLEEVGLELLASTPISTEGR